MMSRCAICSHANGFKNRWLMGIAVEISFQDGSIEFGRYLMIDVEIRESVDLPETTCQASAIARDWGAAA